MPHYRTLGQFTPDALFTGGFPIITHTVTLAAGQSLKRGAALGQIQATGKYVLSQEGVKDGSEQPSAILCEARDTTAGDVDVVVYLSGQFNARAVQFGTGHTAASTFQTLRAHNIYLTDTI